MGVVNETVEDGVGKSRIADRLVPVAHGELAGEEGGAHAVAVLHHLEQVGSLRVGERLQREVVEDQQLGAGETAEQSRVGAVAVGDGEGLEEAWWMNSGVSRDMVL